MKKNYAQRLEKLKKRRLDESLQRSILTNSFSDVSINDSAKYALESMSDIDPKYTQNTYLASENICNNLTPALQRRGLSVEYRHQGSITTNTHIKIHSDIDVLVFTDKYVNMEPPLTPANPYQGDPLADLKQLRQECFNILNGIYDQVDDSNSKSIQVFPTSPKRKVDVVPCNWINTMEYQNTYNEKYRGVHVYDKENNSRHKDFPFLNIEAHISAVLFS
jgi:hypothetical protein